MRPKRHPRTRTALGGGIFLPPRRPFPEPPARGEGRREADLPWRGTGLAPSGGADPPSTRWKKPFPNGAKGCTCPRRPRPCHRPPPGSRRSRSRVRRQPRPAFWHGESHRRWVQRRVAEGPLPAPLPSIFHGLLFSVPAPGMRTGARPRKPLVLAQAPGSGRPSVVTLPVVGISLRLHRALPCAHLGPCNERTPASNPRP